jgi:hypothetical protein
VTTPAGLFHLTRQDWGADPIVRGSSGAPRPALPRPVVWLTVHYTGNTTPLYTADRAAVIAAQQGLERFAQSQGKPNEYNYSLYMAGGAGYVVDYADGYVAAHSAGENERSVGVLFWVGVGQAVPDAMVTAYRWLRDQLLTPAGLVVPGSTSQTPHKQMPGAATPCPGPVMDRWDDLLVPFHNGEPAMGRVLVRNGNDPTGPGDTGWNAWVVSDTGKYWIPTNEALAIAQAELGDPIDVTDDWMRAHGPVMGTNPGGDEWGCWKKTT